MRKLTGFALSLLGMLAVSTGSANAAVVPVASPIVADITPITSAGTQVAIIGGAILLVALAIKGWKMLKGV